MRLFGKRPRDAARPALSRVAATGGYARLIGGDWPAGYESQVRAGYADNPVAQRAVKLVMNAVAEAPLEPCDPAAAELVAARSAGQPLLATIAAHLLLHGNAYVQVLRGSDGGVAELFALRPERVTIEADAGGWPATFAYRVGERVTRLHGDAPRPEVVHIKTFHPLDDHYGLGCLAAAAQGIAIHNAAAQWNRALLANAARPSGALVYAPDDGGTLSAEQFERLRAEMDAAFAGAGNAGRPMLLEGGLRWQALSLSPAEMDFAGLKAAAARDIALAFGVPPMLLGLPGDNTYANLKEAGRALWRLTVLPLAGEIFASLSQGLAAWFPGLGLAVDLNRVPALAEDRAMLWRSVTAADFLSDAEKRALVGVASRAETQA
jgi:HK97 family phage portal protein